MNWEENRQKGAKKQGRAAPAPYNDVFYSGGFRKTSKKIIKKTNKNKKSSKKKYNKTKKNKNKNTNKKN